MRDMNDIEESPSEKACKTTSRDVKCKYYVN